MKNAAKVGQVVVVRSESAGKDKERMAVVAYCTRWGTVGVQYRRPDGSLTRARRLKGNQVIARPATRVEQVAFQDGLQ